MRRLHHLSAIYAYSKGSKERDILRIAWTGSICQAEWNNLNLFLRQHLRTDYDLKDLIKLTFRAIPETEDEYEIEADLAQPLASVPLTTGSKKSRKLSQRSQHPKRRTKKTGLTFSIPTAGFSAEDLEALDIFDSLDTEGRLGFWSECLARHSRPK